MSKRFALKAATDDIHQQLDETLSRFDLADPDDYAKFLAVHARTVPAIEAALADGGVADIIDDWLEEGRSGAIARDLAALGRPMPAPASTPRIDTVGALLGTAYVLEGSRLGGQVLRRRVGEGLPISYLGLLGADGSWPTVVAAIERHLYSDDQFGEARDAARRCFALFLTVAREAVT